MFHRSYEPRTFSNWKIIQTRADAPDVDVPSPCTLGVSRESYATLLISFPSTSHHYGNWSFTRIPWADGLFPPQGNRLVYQPRAERASYWSFPVVSRSGRCSLALETSGMPVGHIFWMDSLHPQNTMSPQEADDLHIPRYV